MIDVKGRFKALKESGNFKLTEYVIPGTMLCKAIGRFDSTISIFHHKGDAIATHYSF